MHQLAERGREWGGVSVNWIFAIRFADQADIVKLLGLFRELPNEKLANRISTRDYSHVVERLQFGIPFFFPPASD